MFSELSSKRIPTGKFIKREPGASFRVTHNNNNITKEGLGPTRASKDMTYLAQELRQPKGLGL